MSKVTRKNKENPPAWLDANRDISHTSESNKPHYERSIKYYNKVLLSIGSWTDDKRIKSIYKKRDRLRKLGFDVVVDHIVPVVSDFVCGLECHWNMEIITALENGKKGNRYWPDCPATINGVPVQEDFFMDGDQNKLF